MRVARVCSIRILCLAISWLVLIAPSVSAQIGSGEITGVVDDQTGAAVPGVSVTMTQVDTGRQRLLITSSDGVYAATSLVPGAYRIEVALSGFKPIRRDGIQVLTGAKLRVDFELAVGDLSEQINVTADAPIMRAETASLGYVVRNDQVTRIPLNGRAYIGLASLAPGVALPANSQLPRINGGRPRTNEYLYDGISVLQPEPGQVAYFPVIDAIQEFKIESNSPPAEFGRFNGGVINLTTKSGANVFHGDGFEFYRNEALNARNYFQSTVPVKPDYNRNQFGGTARWSDRQGPHLLLRRLPGTAAVNRPHGDVHGADGAAAAGHFYRVDCRPRPGHLRPGDDRRLGSDGVSGQRDSGQPDRSRSRSLCCRAIRCPRLREPPTTTAGSTTKSITRISGTCASITDSPRISDSVFARLTYFRDGFLPVTPLPDGSGVTSGTLGPQDTSAWAFASNYQHTFADHLFNELRIGNTTRTVGRTAAQLTSSAGSALSIPGIPSNAQFPNTLPTFLISGYQQLGSPPNTASNFHTGVSEIADSLTWLKGAHTVKMGLDWRWERLNVIQPPSPTGSFTFNAIGSDQPGVTNTGTPFASFLLGQVQLFSIDLQQQEIEERARFQEYFIQDDWKATDRLTVNAGLRYTLNFPSTEINGQTGGVQPADAAARLSR